MESTDAAPDAKVHPAADGASSDAAGQPDASAQPDAAGQPVAGDPPSTRRLTRSATRFLARRRGAVVRLGAWSAAESVQTFLGGYCVARSLDDGFLRGGTAAGLLWLVCAAAAVLLGGPVIRGVFAQLPHLTEPLRDALVRRSVAHALHRAATGGPAGDPAAVSRLTSQTEIARDSFAGLVLAARSFVFVAAGAVAGLVALAPQFLLVVLPPLVLGIVLFTASLLPMARAQHRYLDADEAVGRRAQATRAALRDTVACGAQEQTAEANRRAVEEAAAAQRAMARWAAVRTLCVATAGQAPVLLLLAATPWLLREGVGAGAVVGAFTYVLQALLPAVHTLMTVLGTAGARLFVILDRLTQPLPGQPSAPAQRAALRPAPDDLGTRPGHTTPGTPDGPATRAGRAPALELLGVRAAWHPAAPAVLDDLDLTVEEGLHLAVVGPSGIGKSTLLHVAAGLLTPRQGEVRLLGRPVADRHPHHRAALRVLVPQEPYVFTGTLRDNLRYLRPDASRPDVDATVAALGIGPLADRLGGLDRELDPQTLSLGERQLIGVARAHLSTARLLLLDEATCHLDPAAEGVAERALRERPGALVVVAHRLSSALRADRVLVLDGTRAHFGTHTELLARCALYRDLVGHWNDART